MLVSSFAHALQVRHEDAIIDLLCYLLLLSLHSGRACGDSFAGGLALPLALLARVGRFLRQLSTCIVSSPKEKKEEAAKQGGWGGEATHTLASWSYPSSMVWKFPRSFFSFFWIKEQFSLIHPFSLSLSLSLFLFLSLSLSLSLFRFHHARSQA